MRRRRRLSCPPATATPHLHVQRLTPAPRVPLSLHSGVATELTDGFAFGVTVLMALTGLPAADIKQRCRHMLRWPTQPQRWQPPGVPDAAAGSWDGGASSGLAEIVQGLDERWAEERMPLPDVLARLEAMVVAATASSSEAEVAEAEAEARVCIICEEAPREVRFACGHALVCNALPTRRRRAVQEVSDLRPALRRAAGGGARHARARGADLRAAHVGSL